MTNSTNTSTSHQLFEAIEFNAQLKPMHSNNGSMRIEIDYLESEFDGIFPTNSSWSRYVNSIDRDGGAYILSRILGGTKKLKVNNDYMIIEREQWWQDNCTITFKHPIKMVVGGYRSRSGEWLDITEDIDYISGEVTYEWLWKRGDSKANAIEIYLDIRDYGKSQAIPA